MARSTELVIHNVSGLHARPAATFVRAALAESPMSDLLALARRLRNGPTAG